MLLNFTKEETFGVLPKSLIISDILSLHSNSKILNEVYDTKPNLVALLDSDDGKIVLKIFGWRSRFHFLISPFMKSRAQMSWDISSILDAKKLTPKPLFVYTKRKLNFVFDNFFICKAISPHIKFRKFIKEEKSVLNIKKIIKNLAISVANMHESGIYHRDLTTGNFLIDEQLNIFIVDLNRAQNVGILSHKQRLKDLSKIHFKNTEIFPQNDSVKYFFNHYSRLSEININWEEKYLKFRKKMVKRRIKSKKMKKYFRSNFNKTMIHN